MATPIDWKWYVLLVSRKKVGEHWLLGRPARRQVRNPMDGRMMWKDVPRKTKSPRRAASFDTQAEAERFLSLAPKPRGFNAYAEQLPRFADPKKVDSVTIRTEYGPVRLLEGQLALFEEVES